MAEKSKKILITEENHEFLIIRNDLPKIHNFCLNCEKEVEFLNLDSASMQTGIRTREIIHLIETEKIHWIESDKGQLFICKNSLLKM